MQKIHVSRIIREEFVRACAFAISFFVIMFAGFATLAYAANDGGLFGQILNNILTSGNWQSPGDGTVKNSQKLWGKADTDFVKTPTSGITCGVGKCINRIDASGTPQCEP